MRIEKENMDTVWRDILKEQWWWWGDVGRELRATMAHGLVTVFDSQLRGSGLKSSCCHSEV